MTLEIITQNQVFEIVAVIFGLYYFYHTRFRGDPAAVSKYPFTVLVLDILILPSLIILCTLLIARFDNYTVIKNILPNLEIARSALLYLATFWLLARSLDVIVLQKIVFQRTGFTAPLLLRGLAYGIILFSGLTLFLWRIDHPITGFLVSTGVIAGVMGLALQSTLSNLFSGIALSLEKPFKIGDWIELQDKTLGQVIEMTWRSIWLKTFYNTVIYIPNSALAAQQVTNLNKPDAPYSVWYMIKVSPEIEPSFVKTLLTAAVGRCRHVLPTPSPTIRLSNAVENPYIYSVWVHYRNYLAHFRGQEELFTQVHSVLTQAGIQVSSLVQEINFAKKRALAPINLRISDTLRSLEIFEDLDETEIEQIAQVSEFVMVEAETVLMHESEKSTRIYIVLNGELESSVTLENGRKITGENFSAGDSFGWSAIFIEEVAFMTVMAMSDSLVLAINDKCIKPILSKHQHLIQRFTELVSRRMQNLDNARLAATRNRLIPRTPAEIRERIEKFIRS